MELSRIQICITSRLNNAKSLISITQRNVSFIMKQRKIEEDIQAPIPVKFALTSSIVLLILNVLQEIVAQDLIIELKNSIILKSIRLSFVSRILIEWNHVIMGICVHLLIQKMRSLQICLISSPKMLTFTCFILRQYGAHIVTLLMLEMHVFTLTTGKILEENPTSLSMRRSNVLNGKLRISSKLMLMAANMNTDVNILMGGKNKSIIL